MSDEPQDTRDKKLADALRQLVLAIDASGRAILPSSNDELIQSIVEAAARIFGAGGASISLVDRTQQWLEFAFSSGAASGNVVGLRMPINQGIAGFVAMTGQPLAISDVQQDPRFAQEVAQRVGYQPKSILALPLISDERVIGVIEIIDKINAASFGMQDMELLGMFARQAAIAIHASQQFELLNEALVQGIRRLVTADTAASLEQALGRDSDRARSDLMELADLFNSISRLGESERKVCLQVLSAFSEYTRGKPRYA